MMRHYWRTNSTKDVLQWLSQKWHTERTRAPFDFPFSTSLWSVVLKKTVMRLRDTSCRHCWQVAIFKVPISYTFKCLSPRRSTDAHCLALEEPFDEPHAAQWPFAWVKSQREARFNVFSTLPPLSTDAQTVLDDLMNIMSLFIDTLLTQNMGGQSCQKRASESVLESICGLILFD